MINVIKLHTVVVIDLFDAETCFSAEMDGEVSDNCDDVTGLC